ncbi:hypothetical protein [Nitrospira calida]|jgi:hypothetical protein
MVSPSEEICFGEGLDCAKTSRALKEFIRRERQSREDLVSIWWVGIEMAMIVLFLVLLLIQVVFSGPKNRHPPESAWYRYALPFFQILDRGNPTSVPPSICPAVTAIPPCSNS